jgi:acetyl-CoA/propionyl-CoA carboxylase biotin carboxyl carrier protein
VVVEVNGRRLEVSLPGDFTRRSSSSSGGKAKPRRRNGSGKAAAVSGDAVIAPMQGTVVKVAVSDGDPVHTGDLLMVVEAMKMENPITAHQSGTITDLKVQTGTSVTQGTVLCKIAP